MKHCFTEFPTCNECFVEDDIEVGAVTTDPALGVVGPSTRPPPQRLVPTLVLKNIFLMTQLKYVPLNYILDESGSFNLLNHNKITYFGFNLKTYFFETKLFLRFVKKVRP